MHNPFNANGQDLDASLLRQHHHVFLTLRSLKRAKSVRDAHPPCISRRSPSSLTYHESRRKHLSQFRMLTRRCTNELEPGSAGSFDASQCSTPTDSEASFDFGAHSDSESLPDLSDCNSSPGSLQSAITPTKCPGSQYFDNINPLGEVRKRLFQKELNANCCVLPDSEAPAIPTFNSCPSIDAPYNPFVTPSEPELLGLDSADQAKVEHVKPTHAIFGVPELVYKIIEYADAQHVLVPKETSPMRRNQTQTRSKASLLQRTTYGSHQVMHSCLLVNKLFNKVAREIMSTRVFFSNEANFKIFSQNDASYFNAFKPRTFVLNKLFYARQASLERVASSLKCAEMEWLEIFMCPKLKPPITFFHAPLKTLVITGSKVFDDEHLMAAADRCPNLEVVDVRACELVTDCGIYALAKKCRRLRSINVGRKRKGHLITDSSILPLVSSNPRLQTVGLAGCSITDRTLWEIAVTCGKYLERLSLNCCPYITDQSLPAILSHNLTPKLSVLEIKHIENITNFDPIVNFKRRQISNGIVMLIETCDTLLGRLRECEHKMDSVISQRIFRDISEWANSPEDEDRSYLTLRAART